MPEDHIVASGYSAPKATAALEGFLPSGPTGFFVNSTIALEGVVQWLGTLGSAAREIRYGCFDWDPFGGYLPGNVAMVEQDVETMVSRVLALIGERAHPAETILVPCRLKEFPPTE